MRAVISWLLLNYLFASSHRGLLVAVVIMIDSNVSKNWLLNFGGRLL